MVSLHLLGNSGALPLLMLVEDSVNAAKTQMAASFDLHLPGSRAHSSQAFERLFSRWANEQGRHEYAHSSRLGGRNLRVYTTCFAAVVDLNGRGRIRKTRSETRKADPE